MDTKPVITRAKDSEYEQITAFADRCFKGDNGSGYFKSYYPKLYREKNFDGGAHYTLREDGTITALLGSFENTMKVMDTELRFRGLGTMCVDASRRNRGYMQLLIGKAIEDAAADGMDFVFLGGRRQRYELFGVTPSGIAASYVFNRDNARHLYGKDKRFGYTFKRTSEDDAEVLDSILSLYSLKQCRAFRSREKLYDTLCSGFNHIEAVFDKSGGFAGYIICGETHQTAVELETADHGRLGEILNDYLYEFDINSIETAFVFPFEKEKNLFLSRHGEGVNIRSCESMRVLNFKKMIKTFMELKGRYSRLSDGELSFEIKDADRFTIRVKNGVPDVTGITSAPDITLSLLDAENLFFGVWKYVCDREADFPAFAESWFPLPFFLGRPDFV